jgi:hypothetical protein
LPGSNPRIQMSMNISVSDNPRKMTLTKIDDTTVYVKYGRTFEFVDLILENDFFCYICHSLCTNHETWYSTNKSITHNKNVDIKYILIHLTVTTQHMTLTKIDDTTVYVKYGRTLYIIAILRWQPIYLLYIQLYVTFKIVNNSVQFAI